MILVQMLLQKDGSIETAEAEDVRRLWRPEHTNANDERHPPCFHESPEQRDVALPVMKKKIPNPAVVHQQTCKAGYPPYARLIAKWRR